jgi:hypothetical protein
MRNAAAIVLIALGLATSGRPARAEHAPVVVELFTAQGCPYCPQANRFLGELADRKSVVALTFPVDYWDYLGWRDTYAQDGFAERQRAYVDRMQIREIYTPEIVVEGQREAPGLARDKVEELIDQAAAEHSVGPKVRFLRHGTRIEVAGGEAPRGGADVWLVRYDPHPKDVRVKAGENRGKLVIQRNVVRQLIRLGTWRGRARSFSAPSSPDDSWKTLVLVQAAHGGRIFTLGRA